MLDEINEDLDERPPIYRPTVRILPEAEDLLEQINQQLDQFNEDLPHRRIWPQRGFNADITNYSIMSDDSGSSEDNVLPPNLKWDNTLSWNLSNQIYLVCDDFKYLQIIFLSFVTWKDKFIIITNFLSSVQSSFSSYIKIILVENAKQNNIITKYNKNNIVIQNFSRILQLLFSFFTF